MLGAEADPARRAVLRAQRRGDRRHVVLDPRHEIRARHHRLDGRARHDVGQPCLRPGDRAELWPRAGDGHAGRNPAPSRRRCRLSRRLKDEATSAPDIILKLSNIESYYGPIMAIRGISLEVPRGKIVTLLGANGAGKTTVLKPISGILDPQKGSIEFLGKPIQRMAADKIVRLGVSHVPEGREVFPFLSVRENLMMGAYPRSDRDGVAQDLEQVYGYFPRLKERINQPAGQLSGGEQQMLAIGRALMNRPTMLLLDGASLGLSPILVKENF